MKANKYPPQPANDHVSLELLRQYQADALPPAQQHRVEKHLLDCDLCADILLGMEAAPALVTQRAVKEINQQIAAQLESRRKIIPFYADLKNYGVAAAILLLIFSGALVIYYNFTNIKQAEITATVKKEETNQKTATILKPAEPIIAQTTPAAKKGIWVPDKPVIAYQKTAVQQGSPPQVGASENNEMVDIRSNEAFSEAVVMDAIINNRAANPAGQEITEEKKSEDSLLKNNTGSSVPSITLEDLAKVRDVDLEKALSGRVAGVQSDKKENVNIRIRGTASAPMKNDAVVLGRVITGKVSSAEGELLPGVTITLKGSSLGTITDATGKYTLTLPAELEKATLVFSFIGFATTEKQVTPNAAAPVAINLTLKPDTKALQEVVVVGYGTQAKRDVTGAIAYAKPVSGMRAFKKYIQANLKYPQNAQSENVKGRVVVAFTVSSTGALSDFRIIKSLSPACDAEALRLIKEGPSWVPTKKDQTAVSEQVQLAIRFKPPK